MKLFESIMKNFDDDKLGLLGAVLGEHEIKVRDGVEAAVPEILCAIGAKTKSMQGRSLLWRELRDTNDQVASSFSNQLHYQNSRALVENGKQQLSGLVGSEIDEITNRVSHAADIGSSSASKMVGAVSPLIFSSLAAWQKKENVDAGGWQKIFADQSEGLRERAAKASTRRFDAKTGQRTFPSFDKKISTGQGGADNKWTTGSGFTPGYTGAAKQKFNATGSTAASSEANSTQSGKFTTGDAGTSAAAGLGATSGKTTGTNTGQAGKVAAGVAGAAAVAGVAAAGGKVAGAASTASQTASTAAKSVTGSSSLAAGSTSGEKPLWVPDTENLKRERERTAIDRARDQRGQRLASKKSGGWGWLWWQLPLVAGLVGLGWMFKGEISEAFNGPATVVCSDCDIADGSVGTDGSVDLADGSTSPKPKLPSEEAASDSFEGLDSPTVNSIEGSSESQEASFTEDSADASVSSGAVDGTVVDGAMVDGTVIDGALQSSSVEGATTPSSNPSSESSTSSTSSGALQSDDTPKLAPMDGPDASPKLGSETKETVVTETDSIPLLTTDEDMDLQVETALTSLEDDIKGIKDEGSAKLALPKMEEGVTALEELLKTSSTWSDVDKELIDIQLEEAAGEFAKLNKSACKLPNVEGVVSPMFERLEKLLVPQQVVPNQVVPNQVVPHQVDP